MLRKAFSFKATTAEGTFADWGSSSFVSDLMCLRKSHLSGYGFHAKQRINKGSEVLKVSPKLWKPFSAEYSVELMNKTNPKFLSSVVDLSQIMMPKFTSQANTLVQSICLSLNIMTEAQRGIVSPYINLLKQSSYPFNPHALPHPLLLSQENHLDSLLNKDMRVYKDIQLRRNMYTHIGNVLFNGGVNSGTDSGVVDEFKWAIGTILSRGISGSAYPFTLVPILDLVNHNMNNNAEHVYCVNSGDFVLRTIRDVEANEEICINYGSGRDTSSFMSMYGFLGSNPTSTILHNTTKRYDTVDESVGRTTVVDVRTDNTTNINNTTQILNNQLTLENTTSKALNHISNTLNLNDMMTISIPNALIHDIYIDFHTVVTEHEHTTNGSTVITNNGTNFINRPEVTAVDKMDVINAVKQKLSQSAAIMNNKNSCVTVQITKFEIMLKFPLHSVLSMHSSEQSVNEIRQQVYTILESLREHPIESAFATTLSTNDEEMNSEFIQRNQRLLNTICEQALYNYTTKVLLQSYQYKGDYILDTVSLSEKFVARLQELITCEQVKFMQQLQQQQQQQQTQSVVAIASSNIGINVTIESNNENNSSSTVSVTSDFVTNPNPNSSFIINDKRGSIISNSDKTTTFDKSCSGFNAGYDYWKYCCANVIYNEMNALLMLRK